jgi:Ca-activated chloride channel family protein
MNNRRFDMWTGIRSAIARLALALGAAGCAINPVPTPASGSSGSNDQGMGTKNLPGGTADAMSSSDIGKMPDAAASDVGGTAQDDAAGDASPVGYTGLTQAGAQDFGQFRKILEAGGIPTSSSLDDLGFFAEHKLDYPAPTCGQDMCLHALLGIMANMISGSTCTVLQLGLNTPLTVDKLVRPPLHLVIALDVSGSMAGAPLDAVKQGLQQMLDHFKPGDRLSLVTFADDVKVVLEWQDIAAATALEKAILGLQAGSKTDLYGGVFTAYQVAAKHQKPNQQNRVLLLTDGAASKGLLAPQKLVSLATAWAKLGIGITTVGVGEGVDVALLRDIAAVGAGSSYFLDKPAAVKEVFTEEVETFVVPVALDVHIAVAAGSGYVIRGVYGTHGWKGGPDGGVIDIPTLFLAGRTTAAKPLPAQGTARRGGGGAILVELIALPGVQDKSVGHIKLNWTHPQTGQVLSQEVQVDGPYMPGVSIPDQGVFTNPTVEKAFAMLNIYPGLKMACQLAADSDPGAARGVLEALDGVARAWEKQHPDPDIDDDLKYVELFIANLKALAKQTPVSKPPEPWPKKD